MRVVFVQLVLVAVLNATGQLSLKTGAGAMASPDALLTNPLLILKHPYFLAGTALYASSFVLYVNALSRIRLSVAYPFIGLTYVLVVVLSVLVLGEPLDRLTVAGSLLIFAGVSLVGLGATT